MNTSEAKLTKCECWDSLKHHSMQFDSINEHCLSHFSGLNTRLIKERKIMTAFAATNIKISPKEADDIEKILIALDGCIEAKQFGSAVIGNLLDEAEIITEMMQRNGLKGQSSLEAERINQGLLDSLSGPNSFFELDLAFYSTCSAFEDSIFTRVSLSNQAIDSYWRSPYKISIFKKLRTSILELFILRNLWNSSVCSNTKNGTDLLSVKFESIHRKLDSLSLINENYD